MGAVCAPGFLNDEAAGGPGAPEAAASSFDLFSPASYYCGTIRPAPGPCVDSKGKPIQQEYPSGGDTYPIVKAWELSPSKPLQIRYTTGGGENLETMAKLLDGATITTPPKLHIVCTSLFPWSPPCALIKKAVFTKSGKKYAGPVVFFPKTTNIDLFVTVDGKQQEDGLVFCSDASITNPAVGEGAPQGAWCTLISTQFSNRDENSIHLPIVVADPTTAGLLNASSEYGPDFSQAFCQLIARAGPGEHSYTLRLSPRGYMEDSPSYKGIPNASLKDMDAQSQEFAKTLHGKVFSSDPNNPNLNASFKLSISEDIIAKSMSAAEKSAPEPIEAKDYAEIVSCAQRLAGGRPVTIASETLGETVSGNPSHVILATSKDYGNDVGTIRVADGRDVYEFVYIYLLWKSSDDAENEDNPGVMVRIRVEKILKKNHVAVADPKWVLAQTYTGEKIKNKSIQGAIERDTGRY